MSLDQIDPAIAHVLAPLRPLLDDPDDGIVEICVNEYGKVLLELSDGTWKELHRPQIDEKWVRLFIDLLAEFKRQPLDPRKRTLLTSLPGGHRLTASMGPHIGTGVAISIRRYRKAMPDLESWGLNAAQIKFLETLVAEGRTLLVSGATSSGKTTFLNALIRRIPEARRILTVEDVPELRVPHKNHVKLLVARAGGRDHFGPSDAIDLVTRVRPDVVLPGELSVHIAEAAFRLLNTGHASCMTTVHAEDPRGALEAWRINLEIATGHAAEGMLTALVRNIDCVVQLRRLASGERRAVEIAVPRETDWGARLVGGKVLARSELTIDAAARGAKPADLDKSGGSRRKMSQFLGG